MGMPNSKFKTKALCHEKFEIKNVRRRRVGYASSVCLERYWEICRFRGEKQSSQPVNMSRHPYMQTQVKMRT